MMFEVYVLYSDVYDKIYIGFSSDVARRLLSHNVYAKKGWTVRFRPWRIVHRESYSTKKEAMLRERQLKSAKGREWIRRTILKKD